MLDTSDILDPLDMLDISDILDTLDILDIFNILDGKIYIHPIHT